MIYNTCEGCFSHMGGGNCRINLENECAKDERRMYKPTRESGIFGDVVEAWSWAIRHGHSDDCRVERRGSGWVVLWEGQHERTDDDR